MNIIQPSSSLLTPKYGQLPRSEIFSRRYYGRNADLVSIESAILAAQIGIMSPISDLGRELLRNDPAVSGMVFKRCGNLSKCDWDVQPAKVGVDNQMAHQVADACRTALLRFREFRQFLKDMAWAVYDGRAASEINWSITDASEPGPRYWPVSHTWIHPGRLSFGPQRELRIVERYRQTSMLADSYGSSFEGWTYHVGATLNAFEPGRFIQWTPRNFSDYPEREGLCPRILYWQFFKRFSWRYRMTLTELFALPWRIIETDPSADTSVSPEALDDAEEAAQALGAETTMALEPGMHLKVQAIPPESAKLFQMNSEEVNEEIAKLVLMQAGTTDGQQSRASGVIADKQQDFPLQIDGMAFQDIVTEQLLRPFVELNFGRANLVYCPKFFLRTDPPRDRKADLDSATSVLGLGLPLASAEVYEKSGWRKPQHGEELVKQAKPAAGGVGPDGQPLPGAKGPAGELGEGQGGGVGDMVQNLLDAFDEDILNEPDDHQGDADLERHLSLSNAVGRLLQPSSANGSPEPLIDKGVREAARETRGWAAELAAAVTGKDSATQCYTALARCAAKLNVEKFSRSVERKLVHGLMLGALDAHVEMIGDAPIKPTVFQRGVAEGPNGRIDLAGWGVPAGSTGVADFATKPFAGAIKSFAEKRVIGRRAFDRLTAEAKRKAFTVAGLAKADMLETAHDELTKALTAGDDLRAFSKSLADRFEAAGWTPLNPSHVETVFRTNVMGAYSTGRDAQQRQPEVLAARPYFQIIGPNDARTRATHKAAHGKVLAASDPFWGKTNGHMGFNCRCRRVSRSEADIKRLGLTVSSGAELVGLPDEGFDAGL